ncbi:hypothetical protein D3P08_06145 [Paenibacillus nanensis]|uniref:Uncharacterized protein n=1 Tax=Paenibacillus nanensis TaxID=393251 RepID=A0A3A1VHB7_9BACL|nr:hypothetical protein [Paenibacillus nanensis]RIX59704.1 hypothetical protein D3P08_06145 [Paenibacillus nanensis]
MRQTYYGVDPSVRKELEDGLRQFNRLTRSLFDRSADSGKLEGLRKERDTLQDEIQAKLTQSGQVLGFLTEEQLEDLDKLLKEIEDPEIRSLLGANHIPYGCLESVIGALISLPQPPRNLIFFLERAKQKRFHVIVWIM